MAITTSNTSALTPLKGYTGDYIYPNFSLTSKPLPIKEDIYFGMTAGEISSLKLTNESQHKTILELESKVEALTKALEGFIGKSI